MSSEQVTTSDALAPHRLEWIAVDWGTSSLRAWALGPQREIIASAVTRDGMSQVSRGRFEAVLLKTVGAWLPAQVSTRVPVFICGMAGARQGWREAGYREIPCEALIDDQLTQVDTQDPRLCVFIVPGLCQRSPDDVMRGEETQIAGLVSRIGAKPATVCLPGTHSKWVCLQDRRVSKMKTFMTGELFQLLAEQSTLSFAVADEGLNMEEFSHSLETALSDPAEVSSRLFSVRAAALLSELDEISARARLTGLLIGLELAATRNLWQEQEVHLIGDITLSSLYALALAENGARPLIEDAERMTIEGLAALNHEMQQELVQ